MLNKNLSLALLLNFLWINISEVFRYFVFIMPMLRDAFPQIPHIAPMNLKVFLIWGIWDCILVIAVSGFCYLYMEKHKNTFKSAIVSGTLAWLAIFGILWLGMFNMNLATPKILAIALPLSWLELIIAALIVRWTMQRNPLPR